MPSWTVTGPQRMRLDEPAVTRVDVRVVAGRVTVVGTDGPPRVEVSDHAGAPLSVSHEDGVLSIAHADVKAWKGPFSALWWWGKGWKRYQVDVSIAVPYDTPARLWLGQGSMVVSNLHADVVADCVSGRLTVLGVFGTLRAKVVSGPIEALGCAGEMELETVSGEITVADTAAVRLRAKTVSGALTADLDNPPQDCEIRIETVPGEITIRVREDSDLRVALSAAHGRVTSDFPDFNVDRAWGASASGLLGTGRGSGSLRASAVGGNVSLLRRPVDADFDDPSVGSTHPADDEPDES
jgi:hypothetical protein